MNPDLKTESIAIAYLVQNAANGIQDHNGEGVQHMDSLPVGADVGSVDGQKAELQTNATPAMIIISEDDLANTLRQVLTAFKIKPDTVIYI